MPQAVTPTQMRDLPMQLREATLVPSTFNEADNTVEVVWTTGASVRRYDWWNDRPYDEALEVSAEAVDMTRFESGVVQVLDGHRAWGGVGSILGIAQRGWIEAGEGRALLRLSERPELEGVVKDIRAGVIRSISFGYSVERYEITRAQDRTDGINVDLYRAVRWTPNEISFVPVGADPHASTRSHPGSGAANARPSHALQGQPCEFFHRAAAQHQEPFVPQENTPAGGAPADNEQRSSPAGSQPLPAAFDGQRAADITALCQRHGMNELQDQLLRSQATLDQARAAVLDALDKRSAQTAAGPTTQIRTESDEHDVRVRGMQNALLHRFLPAQNPLDDNGRRFRGLSTVEMAREMLQGMGHDVRGMARAQVVDAALKVRSGYMGTGDFPSLLGGVGGRVLRAAYDEQPGTYQLWARRATNLQDFRIRNVITAGGDQELKRLNEHGEYTYGALSEDDTSYRAFSFGRSLGITRAMLVNDDLDAFVRVGTRYANAARRLENRLVYEQLIKNPLMGDGKALFHADHANLKTGAGSALDLEALSAARTAMRKQKGLDGEALNISPTYLIVPSDLETVAYQYTSGNYVPALADQVNEFRAGGRTALTPIVEPLLDASPAAWYLAANSAQIDTVEFAYVEGYEGLRVESFASEDVDGIKVRATLDFAAKVIDHRGLVRSNGA